MSEQYTPTTEKVADAWASRYDGEHASASGEERRGYEAEFARWLAEHDRQVAERAWDEGARWAAVECGAIDDERQAWIAPGDNPYAKGEQK